MSEDRRADWDDLLDRLMQARREMSVLHSIAADNDDLNECYRLAGKMAGVNLAIDYMRGYGP